jgi:hypothetical protein
MKSFFKKVQWKLECLRYDINAFFRPRQKWLTKTIPRKWKDKPELIRDIMFTILVNYMEDEGGDSFFEDKMRDEVKLGYVSEEYFSSLCKRMRLLKEVYIYIKKERPQLEKDIFKALPVVDFDKLHEISQEAYDEAYSLEKQLGERDEWALQTILDNRHYLWS